MSLSTDAVPQSSDQSSRRWSRIVYDCSAAIYYGSTSFKAYYRRGYALTRLKLWEKAILGEFSFVFAIFSNFLSCDSVISFTNRCSST